MGRQPETLLVASIRRAILREYPLAWVVKVAGGPYQQAGIPDLLVCVDGLLVGLEVKKQRIGESEQAARDRATPRQRIALDRIRQAGGTAAVVLSEQEALRAVRGAGGGPQR